MWWDLDTRHLFAVGGTALKKIAHLLGNLAQLGRGLAQKLDPFLYAHLLLLEIPVCMIVV